MYGLTTIPFLTESGKSQKAPDETYGSNVVRDKGVKKGSKCI